MTVCSFYYDSISFKNHEAPFVENQNDLKCFQNSLTNKTWQISKQFVKKIWLFFAMSFRKREQVVAGRTIHWYCFELVDVINNGWINSIWKGCVPKTVKSPGRTSFEFIRNQDVCNSKIFGLAMKYTSTFLYFWWSRVDALKSLARIKYFRFFLLIFWQWYGKNAITFENFDHTILSIKHASITQ